MLNYLFGGKGEGRHAHGSGRFASRGEARKLIRKSFGGICIDGKRGLGMERSNHHCMIVAPSGSGKSMVQIAPTLLRMKKGGASTVVTDPSGELYLLSAAHLRSIGYRVKCFSVMDTNDFLQLGKPEMEALYPELLVHPTTFNPLHRTNTVHQMEETAELLVNTAFPDAQGDQRFWSDSAIEIIYAFIRALCSPKNGEGSRFHLPCNPQSLLYLIMLYTADFKRLNHIMHHLLEEEKEARLIYDSLITEEQKTVKNVLRTAKAALRKFNNPEICRVTGTESLYFEDIRKRPTAIFIIVPSGKIKNYQFILSLLYTQVFEYCEQTRGGYPVQFLLDETANGGKISHFDTLVSTLRKYNVSVTIVLQYRNQLESIYGKAANLTILENMKSEVYFSGLKHETCKYVSDMMGERTITVSETGFKREGEKESNRSAHRGRKLMTADEVRCMPSDRGLFFHANERPMKVRFTPLYANRHLLQKKGVKMGFSIINRFKRLI